MADTFFIEGLNTLPEQVQLNKEDITKLKDDISKIKPNAIKPNACEERKFNVINEDGSSSEITTYNPVTDINAPVNIQKSFTDKDTYSFSNAINSYSFFVSTTNIFAYVVCSNPTLTLNELLNNDLINTSKQGIIFIGKTTNDKINYELDINCQNIKTNKLTIGNHYISVIEDIYFTSNNNTLLTANAIWKYYLTKEKASTTYATINALKPLQNTYFDADLTTAGLAKIQANATIGTSITLVKDTDFIENITNLDFTHRTAIFTLYLDDDEEVYISEKIKLDIANTTDYYSDNDRPHIWFTGLGVIKLGSASVSSNNYLCYIAYDTTSTRGLMITPVQKLN